MANLTVTSMVKLLKESRVLTGDQLQAVDTLVDETGVAGETGQDTKNFAKKLVGESLLTRWQADQLLAGRCKFFLGKYRLLRRIGKGGMGSVYEARHEIMGRTVALKVMSPALLNNEMAVQRFSREVEAAAKLNHPNIVTAYDADCDGKIHFLVMEFVKGRDLKYWLDHHSPLPDEWICECGRQTAEGLQHAHINSMAHRDIKPSNILIIADSTDCRPNVKILDMGLARIITDNVEDAGLTNSGQVLGTPDYISPEQAQDTRAADIRSDIYSLGCSLFHLLTGKVPFEGESIMAKLLVRIQEDAPRVSTLRPDIDPELDHLVAAMLARDPELRPQTPAIVSQMLARHIGSFQTAAIVGGHTMLTQGTAITDGTAITHGTAVSSGGGSSDSRSSGDLTAADTAGNHAAETVDDPQRSPADSPVLRPVPTAASSNSKKKTILLASVGAAICLVVAAVVGSMLFGGSGDRQPDKLVAKRGNEPATLQQRTAPVADRVESDDAGNVSTTSSDSGEADLASANDRDGNEQEPAVSDATSETTIDKGDQTADIAIAANEATAATDSDSEQSETDPNTLDPATVDDQEPPRTSVPKTLTVGTRSNELPDLKQAIAEAKPGDTIVIRHRGPFELTSLSLEDKTPLTIRGGKDELGNGFWPILRQAIPNNAESGESKYVASRGFINAPELNLRLQNLHLVVGGANRVDPGSVFWCRYGRIILDDCTITAAYQDETKGIAGPTFPMVHVDTWTGPRPDAVIDSADEDGESDTAGNSYQAQLTMNRCLMRGARLSGIVTASNTEAIKVQAQHLTWAGGPGPWLEMDHVLNGCDLLLKQCTIYNVTNLMKWKMHQQPARGESLAARVYAEKVLCVGTYGNPAPLIDWEMEEGECDLAQLKNDELFVWRGSKNVFDRFGGFFAEDDRGRYASLRKWTTLLDQVTPNLARESDPIFRLWPSGYELQEVQARDLEPQFWLAKRRTTAVKDRDIGSHISAMPRIPKAVDRIPVNAPNQTAMGYYPPKILEVNEQSGPFRTITDAIKASNAGDIIEITDNGVYQPRRDFKSNPGTAVISLNNTSLTIRAAEEKYPTIVLDERVQGNMPDIPLILFQLNQVDLELEGISFGIVATENPRARLIEHIGDSVRIFRCSFVDLFNSRLAPDPPGGVYRSPILTTQSRFLWFENNVVFKNTPDLNVIQFGARNTVARNCLIEGAFAEAPSRTAGANGVLEIHNCTVLGGSLVSVDGEAYENTRILVTETVAYGENVLRVGNENYINKLLWTGRDNTLAASKAYAMSTNGNALMIRNMGGWQQRWGESSTNERGLIPAFESKATASDPLRKFELKKNQIAASMAADGSSIGVKTEYLPVVPSLSRKR